MTQGDVTYRFTDADAEPTKTLTPIKGYEKKNLVSLEKAAAEINPPIDDIDTMVWTAKRNSRNPVDGLTPNESAAIHLYTAEWPEGQKSIYHLLNEKLRSEKRNGLISWFSYLKLLLTALHKLPSLKATVWRGIRDDVSDLYQDDFIWWGVSSCTESMNVMERFVGRSGIRTIFMIECINGKAIRSHSFYKDENEIILMPGTYLRVIGKWSPADGLHMIHLREETPPCQLVTPPFDYSSSNNTITSLKPTISMPSQLHNQAASSFVSTTPSLKRMISTPNPSSNQPVSSSINPTPLLKSTISMPNQSNYESVSTKQHGKLFF